MFFFWKKEQSVIKKILEYLNQIDICRGRFNSCMKILIKEGISKKNKEMVEEIHHSESKADDFRREIEHDLYNKALIPELRGDVLGLLETLDKIPNLFQSICFQISLQKIIIPSELINDFTILVNVNIEASDLINKCVKGFFFKKNVMKELDEIDKKESESDTEERNLIEKIFNLEIEKADKILLKEIVINIGEISDQAESIADRLNIAIIKRRI